MPNPRWRFARMAPAEINQNPVQGEFFTAASDLPERFVREAIQNSLDAKSGDAPVRVRFAFSEHPLPAAAARHYLEGIDQHLDATVEMPDAVAEGRPIAMDELAAARNARELLNGDMHYLAVEDFGTTGLTGSIVANSEWEEGNHFWGFFRSVGISPKPDDKGGSWGLGKWVFPDASQLNIFIGLTRRFGDGDTLLMGQAVLKTHTIEQDGEQAKYPAYGSFAQHDAAEDHRWLPLPEQGSEFVTQAQRDFDLERIDQPGLSIVIPHPKPELSADALARAVLTQYFLPIVRGDLIVEVSAPDGAHLIDAETIDDELAKVAPGGADEDERRDDETAESLRKAVDLARWALDQNPSSCITLPASVRRKTELETDLLDQLRERYARGDRLAFALTNRVKRATGPEMECTFHVFVERADELPKGHDYFIRGHLRIPKMDYITRYKARALVLVDGKSELGHLLRDAEGPAHAEWKLGGERLVQRWTGVGRGGRVDEVRQAAPRLLQQLIEVPKQQLKTLLADIFPKDLPAEAAPVPPGSDADGSDKTGEVVDLPSRSRDPIVVSKFEDGFSVHANSSLETPQPLAGSTYRLEFAYDVARGSQSTPFTRFKQGVKDGCPDFSLRKGQLNIAYDGCSPRNLSENEIEVAVDADQFYLRVTGFDGRDVVARFNQTSSAVAAQDDD